MKKMVSQIFKRKLQSGCNISSNLHHTYISWSQGFNSTIQLGFVLTYRLLICLNLPLEVHYFHVQRTHVAITMGTKYRGKILLRQNHSLWGTRRTEYTQWTLHVQVQLSNYYNKYIYYPTLLPRVQITCETSTNIMRYLYSSHSPDCAKDKKPWQVRILGKQKRWIINLLLDILVCSIALNFYSSFVFWLALPARQNTAWLVKIYSDTVYWKV